MNRTPYVPAEPWSGGPPGLPQVHVSPLPSGGYPSSGYGSGSPFEGDSGSGMREMANTLLQNWRWIAAMFAVALGATVLYLLFATPVYRIDALVQVEDRKPLQISSAANPANQGGLQLPPSPLLGEVEILRSRELLLRSVAATGTDVDVAVLNRMPIVGGMAARWWESSHAGLAPGPAGLGQWAWGGEDIQFARFDLPPALLDVPLHMTVDGDRWVLADAAEQPLAEGKVGAPAPFKFGDQQGTVHVRSVTGRPGVRFEILKYSPARLYTELQRNFSVGEAARQSGVIRIAYESADRGGAVRLVDEVTRRYVALTAERRAAEAEQALRFLEQQLPDMKKRLDAAETALSQFRTRTATLNVDQETQNSLQRTAQLERDRVELQLRAQQLSQRYLPAHPELQAIAQQRRIVEGELGRLTNSASQLPGNQRDYVRLQREVQTTSVLYTAALNSTQELQLQRAGMTASARVVDPAGASELPVRPKPAILLSAAAAIGLLVGFGLALVRRQLHPTVQDGEDIETQTGLMTLAYIPESQKQRKLTRWTSVLPGARSRLLALQNPQEPAVESLRSFRSNLVTPDMAGTDKTVLIAAPTAGLGKTFIAANLAALMATAGKRVVLIDGDMRRPRLHRYFKFSSGEGLAEVLAGDRSSTDVIHTDVAPNLDLMLAGHATRNPADLLQSPNLRRLLAELHERYDVVLVDSAPVLPVADALAFAQFGLQAFIVARAERTTVREVREAARRLDGVGGRVQGVLFNGVKRARFSGLSYYAYADGM